MIRGNKKEEPVFLIQYKRRKKPKSWDDYDEEIRNELREHLILEQQGFCPYCERVIGDSKKGHIEHFRPRASYSGQFQDYNNLLAFCNSKSTCGHKKGNSFDEGKMISPIVEEPSDFMEYNVFSGEIEGISANKTERAEYTIKVLNLNDKKLMETRKTIIEYLSDYQKKSKDEYESALDFYKTGAQGFIGLVSYLEKSLSSMDSC